MKIIYCKSISSITVFDSSGVPANDTSIKMDAISETTMIITANVIIFFLFNGAMRHYPTVYYTIFFCTFQEVKGKSYKEMR